MPAILQIQWPLQASGRNWAVSAAWSDKRRQR
jgi:hypothetical protein